MLGILKPVLRTELGWDEEQYGDIVFAFQLAYALMMPLTGRLIDWLGTKLSYTAAVVVWSLAAMAHALARSAGGFSAARFALGFGEAANFPAAIKSVTEWFSPEERALATGIFNSGSNVGAIAAPLMVPWIAANWGWRPAFIITGSLGFIWVVLWLWIYREPAARADRDVPVRIPYLRLLKTRQAWAVLIGKFLTDPVWWFYLFWLPGFLYDRYGLNLTQLGPPLVVVYLAADVGLGWGRVALFEAAGLRHERESSAQTRDARVCDCGCRGRVCDVRRLKHVAGGDACEHRCRFASGMVSERLHRDLGPVPARMGRVRGRFGRNGRSNWRHARCSGTRPIPEMERQALTVPYLSWPARSISSRCLLWTGWFRTSIATESE